MDSLYTSSDIYLNGPEGMRNEVDMWYTGAFMLLQDVIRNKVKSEYGGLHDASGIDLRAALEKVSVLDVCCGPGNFSNYLGLVYPLVHVTGIDTNEEFLVPLPSLEPLRTLVRS